MRLLRSRWLEGLVVWEDLWSLTFLVNRFMFIFYKNIKMTSIKDFLPQNKSKCPDLLGSKIIDLLESIPDYKKDITVNIDSRGWCYVKA
jgi:hypothetical protein